MLKDSISRLTDKLLVMVDPRLVKLLPGSSVWLLMVMGGRVLVPCPIILILFRLIKLKFWHAHQIFC